MAKNDTPGAMQEWAKAIAGNDKEPTWRYRYGRLLLDKNNVREAATHLKFAIDQGKQMQPRPGWLQSAAFDAGEALRKAGQKKDAADAYRLYLELAGPSSPYVKDARQQLTAMGEPFTLDR